MNAPSEPASGLEREVDAPTDLGATELPVRTIRIRFSGALTISRYKSFRILKLRVVDDHLEIAVKPMGYIPWTWLRYPLLAISSWSLTEPHLETVYWRHLTEELRAEFREAFEATR